MPASREQQVKNGLLYLLPLIVRNLLPLIGLGIFTRILTKEDYGIFALAQAYALFVGGWANMGMTTAYNRNFYQYENDPLKSAQLLYSVLCFVSLNFLFLSLLTYLFQDILSVWVAKSSTYGNLFFLSVCAQFFLNLGHHYYLKFLRNSEKAKDYVVYNIAGSVINFLASLFFVYYMRVGVVGLVYGQLVSGFIITVFLSLRFAVILPPSIDKTIFVEAFKIAYPITPRIFFGVIGTHFDKYMVGLIASIGGAGIYSIGQKISNLVFTFMTSIENVFSPQVYKKMFDLKESGGEVIGKYLTPFVYISIFVGLVVALFSQEAITLLTPSSYHGAIDIVTILAMYYGLLFIGKITGPQLIYKKKMFLGSSLAVARIGINVGINIPFIIKWGALGAAWATLISGILSGIIGFAVAQHYYRIRWEVGNLLYIYSVFLGFSIFIIIMRSAVLPYPLLLVVKLVALGAYTLIGIKVGVISAENYRLVTEMVPGLFRMRFRTDA